jgi:hypothetical protein
LERQIDENHLRKVDKYYANNLLDAYENDKMAKDRFVNENRNNWERLNRDS